jgi:hypothetical protein
MPETPDTPDWVRTATTAKVWNERIHYHQWQQKEHGSWWGGAYSSRKAAEARRLEIMADRLFDCYVTGNKPTGGNRCSMILEEYTAMWNRYLARA